MAGRHVFIWQASLLVDFLFIVICHIHKLFWIVIYTPTFCLPTTAGARLSLRQPRLRPTPAAIPIRPRASARTL